MKYLVPKDKKRRLIVKKFEFKRMLLRTCYFDRRLPDSFRFYCFRKLDFLGRDGSPSRIRNRCVLSGRGRGVYSFFGLSRFCFKRLAANGLLTGVEKTGW